MGEALMEINPGDRIFVRPVDYTRVTRHTLCMTDTIAPELAIVWEDPPAPTKRGRKMPNVPWEQIARLVKRKPGEWAVVWTFDTISGAKNAVAKPDFREHLPEESWDYQVRSFRDEPRMVDGEMKAQKTGISKVWVRYNPD